ncbi:MAG: exodeoxyribonuclease III [Thermales bacterium]|nr:exodeoxyribonuclease III [Thermales bacterium]
MSKKIISWNVNGIRAILKKGFEDFVRDQDPEIICIQETKASPDQLELKLEKYPYKYWNSAEKKGYSGTAIFSKTEPITVIYGLGVDDLDKEGRVIGLEYDNFFLVTVYTPNSKEDLSRIPYRYDKWDPAFLKYCKNLERKKPVIFCGDLNVAHQEIDLKNDKANRGKHGFTDEEREGFSNFVEAGLIDTFRNLHPEEVKYTWWSYFRNARATNAGWRIDYFLISESLKPKLTKAFILDEVYGSDHCPVGIEIDL